MFEPEAKPSGEKTYLIPPVWFLIFFAGIIAAGEAMPGRILFPLVQKGGAGLFLTIGALLPLAALVQFRRAGTTYHPHTPGATSALVTSGVYRLTRNPMYVGMALILAAVAFWYGTLLGGLLVPVFVGVLTAVQIVPEERALHRLFGEEFVRFQHRTPRWLFL